MGNVKEIPLSRGLVALVDDADFDRLVQHKWSYDSGYAARQVPLGNGRYQKQYMHREITGAPKGTGVDHVDGNRLDNRRTNLRLCSQAENLCNSKPRSTKRTSSYKGVHWDRKKRKWTAEIAKGGRRHHLGRFTTEMEAAKAYNDAARLLHGEFAKLNEIAMEPRKNTLHA